METVTVNMNCMDSLRAAARKLSVSVEAIKAAFAAAGQSMLNTEQVFKEIAEQLLPAEKREEVVIEIRMDWDVLLTIGLKPLVFPSKPMQLESTYG